LVVLLEENNRPDAIRIGEELLELALHR